MRKFWNLSLFLLSKEEKRWSCEYTGTFPPHPSTDVCSILLEMPIWHSQSIYYLGVQPGLLANKDNYHPLTAFFLPNYINYPYHFFLKVNITKSNYFPECIHHMSAKNAHSNFQFVMFYYCYMNSMKLCYLIPLLKGLWNSQYECIWQRVFSEEYVLNQWEKYTNLKLRNETETWASNLAW